MPTISCTEFNRQLAEAVERRESVDTVWLREHAAGCADCRAQWLDALVVDRALAQWKKPVVPVGLTDRIVAQVVADTAVLTADGPLGTEIVPAEMVPGEMAPVVTSGTDVAVRPSRRGNRTTAAAFTALALCVCAMLLFNRQRPQNPGQPAAANKADVAQNSKHVGAVNPGAVETVAVPTTRQTVPQPATTLSASTPAVPVNGAPVEVMVADAGSAYLHLAGDAAKAVTAASVLVPSADVVEEPASSPKDEEPWVDGMRREIAPVTHQLSHAFEFLIQAVPEKRSPAT